MACGVDSGANAILPHAVRSSRATNLFHTLKVSAGPLLSLAAGQPPASYIPCSASCRCSASPDCYPDAPEQNESTGTKTFTLFGPAGGGTNLTAFHFETKASARC